MNSRDLLSRAMKLKPVDRIPVMCQMSIGHMILQTGVSPIDLWHDTHTYVNVLFDLREKYNFDGILVSVPGSFPSWKKYIKKIEKNINGYIVYWKKEIENYSPYPLGKITSYPKTDLPYRLTEFTAGNITDFNPESKKMLKCVPEYMLSNLKEVQKRNKDRFSIHGETISPLDKFVEFFGLEDSLINLKLHPEKSLFVLEKCVEYSYNWAASQAESGIDALKISSPYAGSNFISIEYYKKFVQPFEKKLISELKKNFKIPVYLHTCGSIGDRLELMVESGIDGIECLDPPPLGDVELEDAFKRIGNSVFIKGNVDSVNTLLLKKPGDAEKDIHRVLETGSRYNGFILSTACSIAPDVPSKNIKLLFECALNYSKKKNRSV